jgi:hypothetical protein
MVKCDKADCKYRIIKKDSKSTPRGHGKQHTSKFKGHGTCIAGYSKRLGVCGDNDAG